MKQLLAIFLLSFLAIQVIAQPKPQAKPTTTATTPAKPRAAVPYITKKDFDSSVTKFNNQIKGLQQSLTTIKSGINSKDGDIKALQGQMQKVEDVLNSTNFKISLTSDSLSQTRMSLEEVQKTNETRFTDLETRLAKAESSSKILWVISILALVAAGGVWFILNKKVQALEGTVRKSLRDFQTTQEEKLSFVEKELNKMEHLIKTETKNNHHYTERMAAAIKDEIVGVRTNAEKMQATIDAITGEINDLHERTKPRS